VASNAPPCPGVRSRNMKSKLVLSVCAGLALAGGLAAASPKPVSAVEVNFLEPDRFTDVNSGWGTDFDRDSYLDALKDIVTRQAQYQLPAGQKLTVTFTDVDLAGDFEPWRGVRFHDIRIVKALYPARLQFSFKLTGANGEVLKQGTRDLRESLFVSRFGAGFDLLPHEREILEGWLRTEFPRARAS
jgi:hypothetical protein